jgi:hypothetical protein
VLDKKITLPSGAFPIDFPLAAVSMTSTFLKTCFVFLPDMGQK